MKVLIDTCVWSQVLRRHSPNVIFESVLKDLIDDGRIVMIGPIRQELLSGISNNSQFEKLRDNLSAFEDAPLESKYFTKAAEFNNLCMKNGVQGSTTDFLICSAAHYLNIPVFTTDSDFTLYKKYLPIDLFKY